MYQKIVFECPGDRLKAYLVHNVLSALLKARIEMCDPIKESYMINVYPQPIQAKVVAMLCVLAIEKILELEVTPKFEYWYEIREHESADH